MLTYETEILIDAPPTEVWKHLTDFDSHSSWTRHFNLRGAPVIGERAQIEFSLLGRRNRVPVVIAKVDEERELRWRGGPRGVAYGSHFFILQPEDSGRRTHFRHGEDFSGILALLVWTFLKAGLGSFYSRFNEDLKRRAESA